IYELATENFSLIDRSDGLSSNEINAIMRYDSLIWLGTPQGLCSIVPDGSYTDQLKPPIRIQEFKGGNKRYPVKSGTRFPSNVNDVSIKFSGLSYRSRDKLAYYYLLWKEGEQGNWVRTQNQEVDFPDLSAGQYAFKVVAVNADGYQSTEPAMITFEIVPKWFNRIAVRILIIFFFVALAAFLSYTFFKMKQNRLAQKNAVEVQMNTLRQKALQAQMNPHFIFNAMNSIMHFLSQNDRKSAMDYLAVFARLIRMIFDFSRRELIGLKEEVSFLKHYLQLEQLRFEDRIQTIIEVDESLYNHRVLLPPLLIQPLIENAYKHGLMHKTGKGYLKIQFSDQGSKMLVMIEDNGVGREKARSIQAKSRLVKNHESSGLSTTKDRLNTLNQQNPIAVGQYGLEVIDLYDAYQESVGTRVVLTIPILGS
ncbi:MAG: histidine kinase, partial [Bacteroidota bacterium]